MKFIYSTLIFLIMMFVNVSQAFNCGGVVDLMIITKAGYINLDINNVDGSSYTRFYVCNLDNEWKGVSQTTCAFWYNVIETARKENKLIVMDFDQTGTSYSTCSDLEESDLSIPPEYILFVDLP